MKVMPNQARENSMNRRKREIQKASSVGVFRRMKKPGKYNCAGFCRRSVNSICRHFGKFSSSVLCWLIFVSCVSAQQTNPPTTTPNTPPPPTTEPTTAQPSQTRTQTNPPTGNQPNQTTQTAAPTQPTTTPTNASGATPGGTTTNPPAVIPASPTQNVGTSGAAPAILPDDPPPVAPNFEAPIRPLPSAERVGVDLMNQLTLTLDQVIEMALQNSNDIDASRNTVQIAEFNLRAARGVYDPTIVSQDYYERRTTPTASTIGGATNGSVTQSSLVNGIGASGFSRYAGGSYAADFSSSRLNSTNQNATLNPQFPSALTLSYTQPLFRGRKFDNNRRQIEIARKNLNLTDAQFRQKAIEVIAQVEQAYWDLTYALRNLQVQIDAVKQAREQLASNQRLVSKGILAPIDIIAANSQITTFEQSVYTAQEEVTRAENNLKTIMLPDRTSPVWSQPITPVSEVSLEAPRVPLESALADALKNRPELTQLQSSAEINKIDLRYYKEQTKPQIDLIAGYTSQGLAGTQQIRAATTVSTTSLLTQRVNDLSALAGFDPLPVTTTTAATVPPNLVGGYVKSLTNLFQQDYPTYRVGVAISLPFGNHVAKANLGRTLVEGTRLGNQRAQQEQVIEGEVRNALQALRSAEARLASALASRQSSEQLYASQQRQFRAGTATFYLVLQRQTELLAARGRELQAQTDLNKAISEFQRSTGTTLSANNVTVSGGGSLQKTGFRRDTAFNLQAQPKSKTE